MVGGLARCLDWALPPHQAQDEEGQARNASILCVFDVHCYCEDIGGSRGKGKSGVEIGYQELCSSCEVPCCRVAFREGEQNATFLKGFGPGTRGKVTF